MHLLVENLIDVLIFVQILLERENLVVLSECIVFVDHRSVAVVQKISIFLLDVVFYQCCVPTLSNT